MNNRLRLSCMWCVLAGGILLMSVLPGRNWFYQILAPYYANDWARFFVYAAAASIPCVAWHKKRRVLYCLAIISFGVVFEFLRATAGLGGQPDVVFSDLFGIAAGILFGLNLRLMSVSLGADTRIAQSQHKPTTL